MGTTVSPAGRPLARASKRMLALRGDAQLVGRVRAGDVAAFEVLYERHLPGILSFCRHMLGSREEAEDAVQQVFASAHRGLETAESEIDLKPWLYAIARNRSLSVLRARREHPAGEVEASTAGLHEDVERRADLRELVADLRRLPEDQRAALVLTELQALTHEEVARVLGCDKGKVKGLVFRARSGLFERREARDASCESIRAELATARGGTLRRGHLRHHLDACSACSGYLEDVRRQRKMMALILPVIPSAGLKGSVFGALGLGGGGAAAASGGLGAGVGGAATGAGALGGAAAGVPVAATLAKLAVVGALVGGAGVAGEAALDNDRRDPAPRGPLAPGPAPVAEPRDGAPVPRGDGSAGRRGVGPDGARRSDTAPEGARSRDGGVPGPAARRGRKAGARKGRAGPPSPKARGRGVPKQKPVKPSPQKAPSAPPGQTRGGSNAPNTPAREPSKPPRDEGPTDTPQKPKKTPKPAVPDAGTGGSNPK